MNLYTPYRVELIKLMLKDRIYPAVKTCVNNRYRLYVGIFVYYGFVLNLIFGLGKQLPLRLHFVVTCGFVLFASHNLVNYWTNANEQLKYERPESGFFKSLSMELIFFCIAVGFVLFAFFFTKKYFCNSA